MKNWLPVGVRSGIGHGQDADAIVAQVGMEFIPELVARPAVTLAEGSPPWIMKP
jgi:hypothetical protein